MNETCTKAVKGMPQCKNSLANCANSRAVTGMSITGWKQACNMAVTGCLLRNFALNVTGLFQGCYSVETALLTVPIHELWQGCPSQGGNRVVTWLLQGVYQEILSHDRAVPRLLQCRNSLANCAK